MLQQNFGDIKNLNFMQKKQNTPLSHHKYQSNKPKYYSTQQQIDDPQENQHENANVYIQNQNFMKKQNNQLSNDKYESYRPKLYPKLKINNYQENQSKNAKVYIQSSLAYDRFTRQLENQLTKRNQRNQPAQMIKKHPIKQRHQVKQLLNLPRYSFQVKSQQKLTDKQIKQCQQKFKELQLKQCKQKVKQLKEKQQKNAKEYQEKIQKYEQIIKEYQQKQNDYQQNKKKSIINLDANKIQIQQLNLTIKEFQQKYQKQVKQHNKNKSIILEQQSSINKMKQEYKKKQNQYKKLQTDSKLKYDKVTKQKQDISNKNKNLQQSLATKISQIQKINLLKSELQKQTIKIKSNHKKQIQKFTNKQQQKDRQLSLKINELRQLQTNFQRATLQIQNKHLKLVKLCADVSLFLRQILGYNITISVNNIENFVQQSSLAILNERFLNGTLGQFTNQRLHQLINIINNNNQKRQKRVLGLKLQYKYDSKNYVDFSPNIKNKNNILMVASYKNNLIGGFTHDPVNQTLQSGIQFIFSLSQQKSKILNIRPDRQELTNKEIVRSSQNIITFGNNELMVKHNKLYCNVGNNIFDIFNAKHQKIKTLDFFESQETVQIDAYEFYQVIFY